MGRHLIIIFLLVISFQAHSQEPKLMLPIGHTLGVSSAVFSMNGKQMITSALDNTAKIWDIESGRLLANLQGHTDTVMSADYSPDGKRIITACQDGTAKIWDATSTKLLMSLKGREVPFNYAVFSPDGKRILTSSQDGSAAIWDAVSGKLLFELIGHTGSTWAVFSKDGKKIITVSDDRTARSWDPNTGKSLQIFKGHRGEVWSFEISRDGKKLITGSRDSTAKVWDIEKGTLLFDITSHKEKIGRVDFSADGKRFVTASDDGDVKLWNAETGLLLFNLKAKPIMGVEAPGNYYQDYTYGANFSPDGKKLLTIYRDSATRVWDVETGNLLYSIKRPDEFVNAVSYSKDGKSFALALAFAHVEIYDITNGTLTMDLRGGANFIESLAFSKDSKNILISNWYGSAKLWDASSGTMITELPGKDEDPDGVHAYFSRDSKKILSLIHDTIARIYDGSKGVLLWELRGHKKMVDFGQFSRDAKTLCTFSQDGTCKIWDLQTGKLNQDVNTGDYLGGQMSPDAKNFFTIDMNGLLKLWDIASGRLIKSIQGEPQNTAAMYYGDGTKILTYFPEHDTACKFWEASSGNLLFEIKKTGHTIKSVWFNQTGTHVVINFQNSISGQVDTRVYDPATGRFISTLEQNEGLIDLYFLLSHDGKRIFSAATNGDIKVWDLPTGKKLRELKGLTGDVYAYGHESVSPDNKKFVAGSKSGEIRVWDIETGRVLASLDGHIFHIESTTFSPDGKWIASVSHDHTAKIWNAETGALLYTYISVGEKDYLVLDKDNHFDGTEDARKLLYFTCGTEVIELDQLKDQLWVPNLAERILKGEVINAQKLSDINICNLTPLVDPIEHSSTQYRFRVTPRIGGLGSTILYVNGIEVKRYDPQELVHQGGIYLLSVNKNELQKFFVSGYENAVTVKALTSKNTISSRSVSINIVGKEKATTPPNLFAVVVGVSDYKGDALDLRFAAKDAQDIATAIESSAGKLLNTDGKQHVFVYREHTGEGRDRFPEKNSIRQTFKEIAGKAGANDILLIFFAGHGVLQSEKNQFYFLTADASSATVSGALKDVGISMEELAAWIKPQTMKAQKRILIFDACNSGQAIKEMLSISNTGKNVFASRDDDKGKQIKVIEKLNEKSGVFILSASASDQKAYEIGKYNQGVLTYALLRAIKEEPDILENRQYLNVSRWFNAAEKTVNELARETGARQQPQLVSTTNFNVGIVDDEVRNKISLPFEKWMFTKSEFRNTESRIDNLKLRAQVDQQLERVAENEIGSSILFSPDYDGANIYAINGDYTIKDADVKIALILTKGGTEIRTKFDVSGPVNDLQELSKKITAEAINWLNKNK